MYGRRFCRNCGAMVTTNALGRAAHERGERCAATAARRRGLCPTSLALFDRRRQSAGYHLAPRKDPR